MFERELPTDISDRKPVEIALQNSNVSLSIAQHVAHIGCWEFEVQTQKITWSEELYSLFGLDSSQPAPPYSEYLQKIHPEDRPLLVQCVELAIANGTSYIIDYRAILPNGSICHHEGRGEVSRDAQGQVTKLYGTALDITDRKKSEELLQNLVKGTAAVTGKDFFPALAQSLATALSVSHILAAELIDGRLHTRAFWTDRQLQPNFSYSPQSTPCQLTLKNGMYYHPTQVQQQFPEDDDLKVLGAECYLGVALTDTLGKSIGLLCVLDNQPLTNLPRLHAILQIFAARASVELEREQATQALECLNQELEQRVEQRTIALRASESRYRALMDGASDAILIADARGNLIEVNRKAQELLGYTCDELTQMHMSQIHPPEALQDAIAHFSAVMQGGSVSILSSMALRKSGSCVPVEITGSSIEVAGELFAQGIFRDVTARRRTELELAHSRDLRDEIYHESTDALFLVDPVSLMILDCNRCAVEMFEASSREELIGIEGHTLQKYKFTDAEMQTIVSDISKFGFWKREVEYITKKGDVFWGSLAVKSISIAGADMNLVRVTDISDRKQTEAFLELQNRCLGCIAIGDPLPQTISLLTELLELDINRSLCSALISDNQDRLRSITATHLSTNCNLTIDGMTISEGIIVFGQNSLNVIDIDTNPCWQNYRDLALSNGLRTCWAVPIFVSDSQKITGIFTLYFREPRTPLAHEIKVVKFVAHTASLAIERKQAEMNLKEQLQLTQTLYSQLQKELSDRQVAEKSLRQSETHKSALLRALPDLILRMNKAGTVLESQTSNNFKIIGGDISIGSRIQELFPANIAQQRMDAIEAVLKTGSIEVYEQELITDGHTYMEEVRVVPYKDDEVIVLIRDISDRKQAEAMILQQASRESLLREMTQRIRQSLELHIIFETATQEIRQFLQTDRVCIFKFYPDSNFDDGEFVAESVVEGFDSGIAIAVHDHCFGEQFAPYYQQGRVQVVNDIYNAGLSDCHIKILAQFQVRANLIVPLLVGEILWGLLCVHQCSASRSWQKAEIDFVKQIANQLEIAIQQANIYHQLQNELATKENLFQQLSSELNQKKVLLKEIHHRVKNNLQVMSSILYLQFRNTSPEVKAISEECQNRIESMALIHDQLHRSDDLANIDFQKYIANLTSNLFQCHGTNPALIKLNLEVDNIFLPLDQSIPLGRKGARSKSISLGRGI